MDLITVIIPAYNAEKTIGRAVKSVLNQIGVNLEVLIINDGSTDGTADICADFQSNDNRIKLFSIENHGVSYARNYGLERANGEYIGFVDSDDWIERNMYSILLNTMKKYNAELSVCAFVNKIEGAKHKAESVSIKTGIVEDVEMYGAVYHSKDVGGYLWNKLFKKQLITTKLDERYAQCEDFLFVLHYLQNIRRLAYTNEKLYHYVRQNIIDNYKYTKRSLTLMPAYEDILSVYQDKAEKYVPDIRKHVLKTYLNFRARYKILGDCDKELKTRIQEGIEEYLNSVISDKKISINDKMNILLTYWFPKTMLRLKKRIQYKIKKDGRW